MLHRTNDAGRTRAFPLAALAALLLAAAPVIAEEEDAEAKAVQEEKSIRQFRPKILVGR